LFFDGLGTWVYVAPQAAPSSTQGSAGNYQYPVTLVFNHLRVGAVTLTTGSQGGIASFSLTELATRNTVATQIGYDWLPGRFYFLYAHHLTGDDWGAWVMDWAAATWAFIGSVQAPAGWGSLVNGSLTSVEWAATAAHPGNCAQYPRTDAYFFPVLGYQGAQFTVGTHESSSLTPGDCPSQRDILSNGWIHYRLGADPTG